jgi:U4/U6 small nuclear ribonucleoprotein PRP4
LAGHKSRVARVAFHPSGNFIGTASFDSTWKLWDAERQKELLMQQGHSREVFAIGFQGDGALVGTGGYDSIGRVWDLRTGKSIMVLQGHIKPILSLDWSPCGYQLATAGQDNTIRIWDIRAASCIYNIPAHKSTVTKVKYWHANQSFEKKDSTWTLETFQNESEMVVDIPATSEEMMIDQKGDINLEDLVTKRNFLNGCFLVSSSYDGTCKLWSDGDFKPLKSLSGLEGRLMCCDISGGI